MTTTEQVPNPTGKGGFGDHPENINPGGRPKNSLKSYVAKKLAGMSDEEKDQWIKDHDIKGELQWRMAEGNPQNDITTGGEKFPTPILNELHSHHSPKENTGTEEKA